MVVVVMVVVVQEEKADKAVSAACIVQCFELSLFSVHFPVRAAGL